VASIGQSGRPQQRGLWATGKDTYDMLCGGHWSWDLIPAASPGPRGLRDTARQGDGFSDFGQSMGFWETNVWLTDGTLLC
jgi:hypothetical protein